MAIISSYPTITPKLADKILGSNNVDSYGDPVPGNPTVQYTMTSVKTLVDQAFVQQLYSFQTDTVNIPISQTGQRVVFGGNNQSSPNVTIDATGKIKFLTMGTYYIEQRYQLASDINANVEFYFKKIKETAPVAQIGQTTGLRLKSNASANKTPLIITEIFQVTVANTEYGYWVTTDTTLSPGTLQSMVPSGGFGTPVPSSSITISKLI